MKPNTFTLKDILRLDVVFHFLKYNERMHIHATILGRKWAKLPTRILPLINYLDKHPADVPVIRLDKKFRTYVGYTPLMNYKERKAELQQIIHQKIRKYDKGI